MSPPPIILVLVPTVLLTLHRTHTFEVTMNMMTMTMTITIAMLMTMMTMTNRVKIVRPKKQLLDCVSSSLDQLVQGVRCAANLANKMRMIMAMMVCHMRMRMVMSKMRMMNDDGYDVDVQQDKG